MLGAVAFPLHADDKIVLQLKWLNQAQFAGYHVAQKNGYYDNEDLDVTIRPFMPDPTPIQSIAAGTTDVIIEWMQEGLRAREQGIPLVNIAQIFKNSGLMLICRRASQINMQDGLRGKKVAPGSALIWRISNCCPTGWAFQSVPLPMTRLI